MPSSSLNNSDIIVYNLSKLLPICFDLSFNSIIFDDGFVGVGAFYMLAMLFLYLFFTFLCATTLFISFFGIIEEFLNFYPIGWTRFLIGDSQRWPLVRIEKLSGGIYTSSLYPAKSVVNVLRTFGVAVRGLLIYFFMRILLICKVGERGLLDTIR